MNAVLFALVTVLSTSVGGLCALSLGSRLHLVSGFTAGALLGVVAFDLLPEIFDLSRGLGGDGREAMIALAGGFMSFHLLETVALVHAAHESNYAKHRHPSVGVLSAAAMISHSFVDGVGIGLAFQISTAVGSTVAVAVIAHDFCDGLNTVSLMLMHGNSHAHARRMLAMNAIAPVLGALSTLAFDVPPASLVPCLGCFAGVLLYIGASDILPQAHSRTGPVAAMSSIGFMALGASCIYAILRVTG